MLKWRRIPRPVTPYGVVALIVLIVFWGCVGFAFWWFT